MDVSSRLVALLHQPGPHLDEAALLVAAHARPELVLEEELARLDGVAATVTTPTLDGLVRDLFTSGRFRPNRDAYDDPDNSFLDQVLRRGLGIPITLAIVALEVGRRIGVPLAPVGMPGHFLLRDKVDPEVFVDPFNGGRLIDEGGCRRLFLAVAGPQATWDPAYLDPVDDVSVVARVLANLKRSYAARRDLANLRWVMRLRTQLPAPHADTSREFARLMAPLN